MTSPPGLMTRAATDTSMLLGFSVIALVAYGAGVFALARAAQAVGTLPEPTWFFMIGLSIMGVLALGTGALATFGMVIAFRSRRE